MGHELIYCARCGTRVVPNRFQDGGPIQVGDKSYCPDCAPLVQEADAEVEVAVPARRPVAGPQREVRLRTRAPAPRPRLVWWVSGGALVLVLVVLLVAGLGRGPNPVPAAPPAEQTDPAPAPPPDAHPVPPTPTPAIVPPAPVTPPAPKTETIIGNTVTKKAHRPTCSGLPSEHNRHVFASVEEAIRAGYTPCHTCKPW